MSTRWRILHPGRRGPTTHGGTSTTPDVDRLLDAARATGSPRELAREDETVMLFHRAHLAQTTTSGARLEPAGSTRRGLQALVATGGVVAVMSSGIAFAASGHAPWVHAPTPTASAGRHGTLSDDDPTSARASTAPTSRTTTAAAAGTLGLRGLCRAYVAGNKAERGKALVSPAFAGLVAYAGSADAVPAFCGVVLTADATPAGASEATHPAHPGHPAHPSHPVHPTSPAHPAHPSHPTHPTQGASPTRPAHPSHPAHPTQGSTPMRPLHPTHSAHPSHP